MIEIYMIRVHPDDLGEKRNTPQHEKFAYACGLIKEEVIRPISDALLEDIVIPNADIAKDVYDLTFEPVEKLTNSLFDLLKEEKDVDRTQIIALIKASQRTEAELIEKFNEDKDKIFFYRVIQLIKILLENAKDQQGFIQLDDVCIDTPYKLGSFLSLFLISKQKHLPKDFPVFKLLEDIVNRARKYNTRDM